jgi:hypothetical protein
MLSDFYSANFKICQAVLDVRLIAAYSVDGWFSYIPSGLKRILFKPFFHNGLFAQIHVAQAVEATT